MKSCTFDISYRKMSSSFQFVLRFKAIEFKAKKKSGTFFFLVRIYFLFRHGKIENWDLIWPLSLGERFYLENFHVSSFKKRQIFLFKKLIFFLYSFFSRINSTIWPNLAIIFVHFICYVSHFHLILMWNKISQKWQHSNSFSLCNLADFYYYTNLFSPIMGNTDGKKKKNNKTNHHHIMLNCQQLFTLVVFGVCVCVFTFSCSLSPIR